MKKTSVALFLIFFTFYLYPKKLKLNLATGITVTRGNSNTVRINGKGEFQLVKGKSVLKLLGNFLYGKSREIVDTNKGKVMIAVDKRIKGKFQFHSLASYEYDRVADIKARINFGLGMQLKFIKTEKSEFYISTSYVSEFEDYYEKIMAKRSNRLLIGIFFRKNFWENSIFISRAEYIPNVENFYEDYRLEAEGSLKVLMKKPLWLSITLNNRYNNMPPSETLKKNDLTLITALEILI